MTPEDFERPLRGDVFIALVVIPAVFALVTVVFFGPAMTLCVPVVGIFAAYVVARERTDWQAITALAVVCTLWDLLWIDLLLAFIAEERLRAHIADHWFTNALAIALAVLTVRHLRDRAAYS
jgi:hypothetical protein